MSHLYELQSQSLLIRKEDLGKYTNIENFGAGTNVGSQTSSIQEMELVGGVVGGGAQHQLAVGDGLDLGGQFLDLGLHGGQVHGTMSPSRRSPPWSSTFRVRTLMPS